MNTQEIYASLKCKDITKECFNKVYAIDELPQKNHVQYNPKGECFMVINLDPSYESGSHWIGLCISPSAYCVNEYFDSYGHTPPTIIKDYLEGNYLCQKRQLQSFTSTVCGQWCIYYIWKRCQGFSLLEISKEFKGTTPEENDIYVNKTINQHFPGKNHPLYDFDFLQTSISFNDWI